VRGNEKRRISLEQSFGCSVTLTLKKGSKRMYKLIYDYEDDEGFKTLGIEDSYNNWQDAHDDMISLKKQPCYSNFEIVEIES
jgi:hypothetical protein